MNNNISRRFIIIIIIIINCTLCVNAFCLQCQFAAKQNLSRR